MDETLRIHAVQVTGPCGPGAQTSLVSNHIPAMYRIMTVSVNFPTGCAGLVRAYLFVSIDPTIFAVTPPSGTSILSMLSRDDFLVGDGVTITLDILLPVPVKGTWLKAHIVNADAFPHNVSAIFTIQEMLEP